MNAKTELTLKETNTEVATAQTFTPRFTEAQIASSQLVNATSLPDLASQKQHFVPLSTEYWTPAQEGETKRVFVAGIDMHEVADLETGEIKMLECVMLLEHQGDVLMRFISASKVLVGNIRDAITRGEIIPMSTLTPVSIKFMGQKKNKSNAKLSNRWQILPLVVDEQ